MEYLLIQPDGILKLYHSLRRLCEENGIDRNKINKNQLPVQTPKGKIIGLIPDTRI